MANVATLTAKMQFDINDFLKKSNVVVLNLRGIEGAAGMAGGKVGTFTQTLMAASVGGMAYAASMKAAQVATSAFHLAVGEAKRGINLAMEAQSSETTFRVLLKDGAKAKQLMQDIEKFAMKTPFNVEGTTGAVRGLMGAGVPLRELLPTMHMLGEVSFGNVEVMKQLAVVYGQVRSKGKLLAQDFNQISEKGINMRNALANEAGVAVKDLAKTMEAGKISFEQFHNALLSVSKDQFGGSMDAASKDLKGVMARLGELRDSFLKGVASEVEKELNISGLGDDFVEFGELLKNKVLPDVKDSFRGMTDELITFIDNMRAAGQFIGLDKLDVAKSGARFGAASGKEDRKWGASIGIGSLFGAGFLGAGFGQSRAGAGVAIDTRADIAKMLGGVRDEANKNRASGSALEEAKRKGDMPPFMRDALKSLEYLGRGAKSFGLDASGVGRSVSIPLGRGFGAVGDRFRLGDSSFTERKPTGGLVAGSSEAMSAMIRNMFKDKDKGMAEKQLKVLQGIEKAASATATSIGNAINGLSAGVIGSFSG